MSKIDDLIAKHCPDLPAGRQDGWRDPIDLPNDKSKWYVYVLLCDDGSLYKGFTSDLRTRFIRHLSGDGSVHTKKHKPLCVLYYETFSTEQEAVSREKYLKSGIGREWLKQKLTHLPSKTDCKQAGTKEVNHV